MFENFLSIHDISVYEFNQILELAEKIKKKPSAFQDKLKNKILALIFQKPSLRTRMTFEVGMLQLGGKAVYLGPSDTVMGTRESVEDVAKYVGLWVDGVAVRTFKHAVAEEMANACRVPVINALTDLLHPCQAMSDFFTLREKKGGLSNLKLAYVGDGNNVCHSLLFASAKAGVRLAIASPPGFGPDTGILQRAEEDGKETGFSCCLTSDPVEAVRGADAVYTDTWTSMGKEEEKENRAQIFRPYQVNGRLMAEARPDALFMHCLPARRGEEVTSEVIDSKRSVVYDQAENSLHIQKTVLLLLLGDK